MNLPPSTERLAAASWEDGKATAGHQSVRVKENLQLAEDSADARELGMLVVRAVERSPLFMSATLAGLVYPPLFNKYESGMTFGVHVDNAIRLIPGTTQAAAHRHFGDAVPEQAGRL